MNRERITHVLKKWHFWSWTLFVRGHFRPRNGPGTVIGSAWARFKATGYQGGRGTARHGRHATFRHGTARDYMARHGWHGTARHGNFLTFLHFCCALQSKRHFFDNFFLFCCALQAKRHFFDNFFFFAALNKKRGTFFDIFLAGPRPGQKNAKKCASFFC